MHPITQCGIINLAMSVFRIRVIFSSPTPRSKIALPKRETDPSRSFTTPIYACLPPAIDDDSQSLRAYISRGRPQYRPPISQHQNSL